MFDIDVENILPHREPFLFVDRIIEIEDKHIVTEKKFKKTDAYFKGHFPGNPIVPGVLLIEAMAQTSGILIAHSLDCELFKNISFYLSKVDSIKFKNIVYPDDLVTIDAELLESFEGVFKTYVECKVNSNMAAAGELFLAQIKNT